ncbi:alpha-actinin [Vanrija albida]|uniref:Alpha-actinin n=1 Tax=Vanrija albida TaxID=181172 RepID=A0ABR3PRW2_9TREE
MPPSATTLSTPATPLHAGFPHSPSRGSFALERTRSLGAAKSRENLRAAGASAPPTPGGSQRNSVSMGAGVGARSELEWTEIQSRLNTKLESHGLEPMTSLGKDFSDGVKLIQLLEIMSETSLGRYNKKPFLRVQKAENASKALQFIRDRGVKLTNIGPEDIVDGNLKLILGMIWTLILRFTIAGITEEGLSAKDGLLLWCQRKTVPYPEVDVQNFKSSFSDGLAFCALIHRHRPELIDFDALDKSDNRGNTALAFKVAEESLDIPRLLEVSDICDVEVPDERSVMTYVAEFFHKFSSEDKAETGARRVEKFAEVMQSIMVTRNDFEKRMAVLLEALATQRQGWEAAEQPTSYPDAISQLSQFADYKKTSKRTWVRERQELAQLYSNIQTKLRTYSLRSWEPQEGLRLEDLEASWAELMTAEVARSRVINARIREIKEELRKKLAALAQSFIERLQRVEQAIGSLSGSLQDQKQALVKLSAELPELRTVLTHDIAAANRACVEAKVDENDYTVLTYDDLEFELEIAEEGMRKKIAFVDNQVGDRWSSAADGQMVSAAHTNITPAKLEEFESTFKHFDKDGTNTLSVYEMHSALASLGIVYPDEEVEAIYSQLESQFGALTYEAWLALLVEITKDDVSSGDQLREAFRDVGGDKGYVTQQDLKFANLSPDAVRFLSEAMPAVDASEGSTISSGFDYHTFLEQAFARGARA